MKQGIIHAGREVMFRLNQHENEDAAAFSGSVCNERAIGGCDTDCKKQYDVFYPYQYVFHREQPVEGRVPPEDQKNTVLRKARIRIFCQKVLEQEVYRPELHRPQKKKTKQVPEALPGYNGVLGDAKTLQRVDLPTSRTAAGAVEQHGDGEKCRQKGHEEKTFCKQVFQKEASGLTGQLLGLADEEDDFSGYHENQDRQDFQYAASREKLEKR